MKQEAGVSVLLSGNYNNFQCHRPVPAGASDEEYLAEFYKAIELCEAALARKRQLTEAQELFGRLCTEYSQIVRLLDSRIEEPPEGPTEAPPPMTDGEKKLQERREAYEILFGGYKDQWTWQQMLDDQNDNPDDQPF